MKKYKFLAIVIFLLFFDNLNHLFVKFKIHCKYQYYQNCFCLKCVQTKSLRKGWSTFQLQFINIRHTLKKKLSVSFIRQVKRHYNALQSHTSLIVTLKIFKVKHAHTHMYMYKHIATEKISVFKKTLYSEKDMDSFNAEYF